ncbi:bifunctional phosphopantothenoylcysteine decarboxylase/phosphopantothenate--cysteine ligase CoaBC [Govanella unica]|uniref:Coenzyme A biosynthesis bifunctional protein CoaBC n=1 Tax=Govanella unica TaxID=2975056 RepID=A0A9X3U027_9PROT|nr:bifunctional phosphopantothenoylcysteine decarboxylase/phosphopantothenate--cysteine ligase CoaBC [Govania unica]MDA5194632.1 bifunctional phosphopantothenoylcysteine decarboxylase/phosphopantothenate--cysteine ligase CoaBC [Govania unica]
MSAKRVLLIIGGGIAAYKCLELIRRLGDQGIAVRAILTRAGAEFVTPLSVASLTGDKVYTELFSLTDESEMGHIRLSREADLVLVAPATADLMAKMAQGLANDLASTALLATDKPVMIAPTMNSRMWDHPATQRNLATLRADGVTIITPGSGALACGEVGAGRLSEPHEILAAVLDFYAARDGLKPLAGRHALVTAGPTYEAIDPVRYIANRSSGKQGYAIAAALQALGARVTLVSGPTALPDPTGVSVIRIESARDMLKACEAALPADIAVCVAAVADWRIDCDAAQKIKKTGGAPPALSFVENPDILATLSKTGPNRPALVIGFAAETEQVIDHARAKRARKGCDWIVANDVSHATGIMGGDRNSVHLITEAGIDTWPDSPKDNVARDLAARIAQFFANPTKDSAPCP